ncbi:MAG: hypothetical protein JO333_11260 [Verrucomicrobia bacterium]|nr:hypothetical protein [Verrucomicrobiota bacterium]
MRSPFSGFLLGLSSLALLGTTAIISGCSADFGGDNVANVYGSSDAAPASTPQVPESMKTGTVSGDVGLPPQGL